MGKNLTICFALLALTSLNVNAQPAKNNAVAIDIDHTQLTLEFDWAKRKAAGKAKIDLHTLHPASILELSAYELTLHEISLAGKKLNYTHDGKTLQIDLNRTYQAGEHLSIVIVYETNYVNEPDPNLLGGSYGKGIRFFEPTTVNPIKRKQIWSQGEWQNNPYWFPCSTRLDDLSTSECIATVPKNLTVISNGNLIAETENANNTKTFHYRTTIPYPSYLTAFAVGEYIDLVQNHKGISLHTFCYPDEKEAAMATTVGLTEMMRFLEEKTGTPYPFESYSQVMVQDYPFPGMTGQNTFSTLSDNMIDDHGTHEDYQYLWDGVAFNALASQWFGSMITPRLTDDVWLTKSFSQFFEGLYMGEKHGNGEYLLWYHPFESGTVFNDWNNGNQHAIVTHQYSDEANFTADSYVKFRGALVLRMLRKELGDKDFFSSIQHFLKNNAFKPCSTADFQTSITTVTGKDMQWFFDQWIYKTGHPVFQVTKEYQSNSGQLTIKIKQIQNNNPAAIKEHPTYFQGKMDIEIDGRAHAVTLLPQAENRFVFSSSKAPQWINPDMENTWIKEIEWLKSKEELLAVFKNSNDYAARNTAMNELAAITQKEADGSPAKQEIIAAFQLVISSNAYWRLRFNAIGQLRSIQTVPYDKKTNDWLVSLIKKENSWTKAAAVTSLGMTNDVQFDGLYISLFQDTSDRVINAAAIALGKTKSPKAFDALMELKNRPSWKGQSLMHVMNGLVLLNDKRTENVALAAINDNHSPRWFLGNGWDYPFVAAQTLAGIGKTATAYPIILQRMKIALEENKTDDVFHQVLLISTLADSRSQEVFDMLKEKYKNDANAMTAVNSYEEQFKTSLKK